MRPRLVICMIVSAFAGVAAAGLSLFGGLGFIVAILVYSATTSVTLLALAIATMPREPKPARPALGRHAAVLEEAQST